MLLFDLSSDTFYPQSCFLITSKKKKEWWAGVGKKYTSKYFGVLDVISELESG